MKKYVYRAVRRRVRGGPILMEFLLLESMG